MDVATGATVGTGTTVGSGTLVGSTVGIGTSVGIIDSVSELTGAVVAVGSALSDVGAGEVSAADVGAVEIVPPAAHPIAATISSNNAKPRNICLRGDFSRKPVNTFTFFTKLPIDT